MRPERLARRLELLAHWISLCLRAPSADLHHGGISRR
jgi:hypothetical protein